MPKKRIIFSLLYDEGHFVLSRNFRLQKIGDLHWLEKNYNFETVSAYIDELVVLNVSRTDDIDWNQFLDTVATLAESNFVPISVGGFGQDAELAKKILRVGADKLVVNSALWENLPLVRKLVDDFGRQCVVGSFDIQKTPAGESSVLVSKGLSQVPGSAMEVLATVPDGLLGEVMIRSVQRDGTGFGLDLDLPTILPGHLHNVPIILSGGVGKPAHIIEGLQSPDVSAVATANLLNFIGQGLEDARRECLEASIDLAHWPPREVRSAS